MPPAPRKINARMTQLLDQFARNDDWLILVNADPDALACAMALKRIMARRVGKVCLASINQISRPDNLAMCRYLHIPLLSWASDLQPLFQKFALVDSQPHHNKLFANISFSLVIDHHPLLPDHPVQANYIDIRPQYGAASTILTEYLKALHIRPGDRLATSLLYGIRTDTGSFTRKVIDSDIKAYQWLGSHADLILLNRIIRSEYLPEWLPYFARALSAFHSCSKGAYAFLGEVENPDILVVVADFFTHVHGLRWVAICGIYRETVVIIFRGDGLSPDLGKFAAERFASLGSAGGHKGLARAEFPLQAVEGKNVEIFVFRKLSVPVKKKLKKHLESPTPQQVSVLEKKNAKRNLEVRQ